MQFFTIPMQVYVRPKMFLLGWFLALCIKEGPVKWAKVCNKSLVMLGPRVFIPHLLLADTLTLLYRPHPSHDGLVPAWFQNVLPGLFFHADMNFQVMNWENLTQYAKKSWNFCSFFRLLKSVPAGKPHIKVGVLV